MDVLNVEVFGKPPERLNNGRPMFIITEHGNDTLPDQILTYFAEDEQKEEYRSWCQTLKHLAAKRMRRIAGSLDEVYHTTPEELAEGEQEPESRPRARRRCGSGSPSTPKKRFNVTEIFT